MGVCVFPFLFTDASVSMIASLPYVPLANTMLSREDVPLIGHMASPNFEKPTNFHFNFTFSPKLSFQISHIHRLNLGLVLIVDIVDV